MVTGGRILNAPPGTTNNLGYIFIRTELVAGQHRSDAEVGKFSTGGEDRPRFGNFIPARSFLSGLEGEYGPLRADAEPAVGQRGEQLRGAKLRCCLTDELAAIAADAVMQGLVAVVGMEKVAELFEREDA